jgi:hypothetical protein
MKMAWWFQVWVESYFEMYFKYASWLSTYMHSPYATKASNCFITKSSGTLKQCYFAKRWVRWRNQRNNLYIKCETKLKRMRERLGGSSPPRGWRPAPANPCRRHSSPTVPHRAARGREEGGGGASLLFSLANRGGRGRSASKVLLAGVCRPPRRWVVYPPIRRCYGRIWGYTEGARLLRGGLEADPVGATAAPRWRGSGAANSGGLQPAAWRRVSPRRWLGGQRRGFPWWGLVAGGRRPATGVSRCPWRCPS